MKILLLGASGLVGNELLQLLLRDERIETVYAPSRRALPPSPKLVNTVSEDLCQIMANWKTPCDIAFCCLGTTRKQAGSDSAFRYVDYTLVVESGRVALANGCRHYLVVSALGANAQSSFLYNRTKGEMEQALKMQGWPHLTIARPSMLQGERAEKRWLEQLSEPIFRMLPGKWKGIKAAGVAQALLNAAFNPPDYQLNILESDQLREMAGEA
ncbi:NAD(P)H-binding protein [Enterobacillus tribolii]|uniref:Putative NAD(P)-binding protein n=1 Tax=Enterobacillus tribolii TaxID=1487935 RepID=A0A370R179_9GAMM|nr:NAD(P)H-binding protein [Enterobacillus tribolii]MBW7982755.1 hypothetical protein [Enterobacillus tribolii]RDK95683.1 putative NAD(P)-binding protein [Enterobacillus tribolii]